MKNFILSFFLLFAVSAVAQDDADRGFVHPGGLHTNADFERIRQQIADGNPTVTEAWNILKSAEYSQSGIQTYPVETIVRGGGVGENYINAARGATMAYQNALRWKIGGTEANAKAAVRILMAWANTTKNIGGDSNYALAAGLYGYQFAQAAELMRDYEGWAADDFATFQRWMLDVWYPSAIGFLRGRNGTWENSSKWWQAPGHYWSNWGLCNALCVISIGVLCDDVFIYNQGLSYMKHDQCGNWKATATDDAILGDGLNEFIGYLIPYVADDERGPYGQLGQMQESGRDQGHATMSLGLAIDIAQTLWNQGNDFYSYKNNRLAAGIEWTAAYNNALIDDLPWHNFHYYTNGFYWTDSRSNLMTAPSAVSRGQTRPYWAKVIGHYEGVLGVKMQYSEIAAQQMGIDAGGTGGTSGAYDHLGYSVLTSTYDGMATPEEVPTLLTPKMTVGGVVYEQAELGGLVNTFQTNNNTGVAKGTVITLSPQLPAAEEDTRLWQWNTGETTREITITANKSYVYRATYTNKNGVKSHQAFSIAVQGDCNDSPDLVQEIVHNGTTHAGKDSISVLYGDVVTLRLTGGAGFGTYRWDNGNASYTRTMTIKSDTTVSIMHKNQGGREQNFTFKIRTYKARPTITINGTLQSGVLEAVANKGDNVVLAPEVSELLIDDASFQWDTGETTPSLTIPSVETTIRRTLTCTIDGETIVMPFELLVSADAASIITPSNYLIYHRATDTYLTSHGKGELVSFERANPDAPDDTQVWFVNNKGTERHAIVCLSDSMALNTSKKTNTTTMYMFYFVPAADTERYALRTGISAAQYKFWTLDADGMFDNTNTSIDEFPYTLIPYGGSTGIDSPSIDTTGNPFDADAVRASEYYLLNGRKVAAPTAPGFYILRQYTKDGVVVRKVLIEK